MIRDRLKQGARRIKGGLRRRLFRTDTSVSSGRATSPVVAAPVSPLAVEPVAPGSPLAVELPVAPVVDVTPPADDIVGSPMTLETVQALFEDMVRPALQSDGGDIDLLKVDNYDVYVRLTGACSSCPSSTVTMKMGVERLLVEEFPQFRNLIQVQG